ncbi:MAG TPA: hypothetical protein VG672_21715, partial [Bryobacteraceae bacterium]|nr:hypothetical protein [Bryobacteraceae bacterium]
MRIRRASFILAFTPCALWATYSYDFTGLPSSSGWTANGTVDHDYSSGIDFYEDSGSFIYQPAVSTETVGGITGSANDYEVSMTLSTPSSTVIEFLRASSNAMRSNGYAAGSFISVEYTSGTIAIKQSVSGTLTQLGSVTVGYSGSTQTLRSVIWGTTLWVFLNNQLVLTNTSLPATSGQPGIGGFLSNDDYWATNITTVSIGHHDIAPPIAPNQSSLRASILPASVSLAWEGVPDDSVGVGVYRYNVLRNGTALTNIVGTPVLTDSTVTAGSTYTYTITAVDFHGNTTPPVSYTAVVPTAGIDPRRTGTYVTGSYWGGGGEQVDTLSGNLNFSIPLLKPMGRTGWSVSVGLSYNSQNWVQDGGVNWSLGTDTGYGYGWTLQIGSVTPYYAGWTSGVDHYVFTDGSGASYRLDQNNGGIWTSLQGLY